MQDYCFNELPLKVLTYEPPLKVLAYELPRPKPTNRFYVGVRLGVYHKIAWGGGGGGGGDLRLS